MGRADVALPGALLGAFAVFLIVLTSLPPSTESLAADAAALVLPDSDMVSIGTNEGATMIVGWDRWATAEFEDERSQDTVHQLMIDRAAELGWTVERQGTGEVGRSVDASRPLTNARITMAPQLDGGERIEASSGRITVSRNEDRRSVLFWGSVVLGGVAGGWLAHRLTPIWRAFSA
jgi:hypothetical protein